jgi:hypothetical protein
MLHLTLPGRRPAALLGTRSIRRAIGCVFGLAVLVALAPASAAQAQLVTDQEAHVVQKADGSMTPQFQEWMRNDSSATDTAWTQTPTEAPSATSVAVEAAEDAKGFKGGLPGRFLPPLRFVIPIVAVGGVTAYEVCSAYITPRCWLFSRDDSSLPPAQTPQWHTPYSGPPTAGGCWGVGLDVCYAQLVGWNAREFMYVYPNEVWGEPWNPDYHCYHANPPQWGVTLRSLGTVSALCYHGILIAPPDGWDSHTVRRGVTVHPGFDILRPQADDPSIPNRSYAIPYDSDWANQLGRYLNGLPSGIANRIRDYIGSLIRPDIIRNPYRTTMNVPDCDGMTFSVCLQRFRDAGYVGTPTREIASFDAADVTKPAAAVLETRPGRGAEIYVDDMVVIRTNPDDADMPRLVPSPTAHETAPSYEARLEALGLTPTRTTVMQTPGDSWAGDVLSVSPIAGTRVRRGASVQLQAAWRPDALYSSDEEQNTVCEPSPTRYEDPGAYGPFTPGQPASFLSIDGSVNLWKGDIAANWGERHIAAKHGWEDQDRIDTASTLVGPSVVERDRPGENVLQGSLYIREMPTRNGVPCLRVVVVERGQWPGEPATRGIITSFGAPAP